jgi:hypothetical protein
MSTASLTVRATIFVLFAASLIIGFTNAPGTFDDYAFINWAKFVGQHGIRAGYAQLSKLSDLDYPPVGVTLMTLSLRLGHVFGWPEQQSFKIPLVVGSFLGPVLAFWRRYAMEDALLLLLVITPYGLVLGGTDVVYLPFLLFAFYAAEAENFGVAGLILAFACMLKWQPIIFAPILLIAGIRHAKNVSQLVRICLPTTILMLVILTFYTPATVFGVFYRATADYDLSGQGLNFAWILSFIFETLHVDGLTFQPNGAINIITVPSPAAAVNISMSVLRYLFYVIFIAHLVIYATGRKTGNALLIGALACAVSQFTWNTGVHEDHFFVSFIAAFAAWQFKVIDNFLFTTAATIAVLSEFLFYGFGDGFNFGNLFGQDCTLFIAVAEIFFYGLVVARQLRISHGHEL